MPSPPYTGSQYNSTGSHLWVLTKRPLTGHYAMETRIAHLPGVTMTMLTIFSVTHTVSSSIIPERIIGGEYYAIEMKDCHREFINPTKNLEPGKGKGIENEETALYTHRAERGLPYRQLYSTKTREEDKEMETWSKDHIRNEHPCGEGSQKLEGKVKSAVMGTHPRYLGEGSVEASTVVLKATYTMPLVTPSITAQSLEKLPGATETTFDTFGSPIQDLDYR